MYGWQSSVWYRNNLIHCLAALCLGAWVIFCKTPCEVGDNTTSSASYPCHKQLGSHLILVRTCKRPWHAKFLDKGHVGERRHFASAQRCVLQMTARETNLTALIYYRPRMLRRLAHHHLWSLENHCRKDHLPQCRLPWAEAKGLFSLAFPLYSESQSHCQTQVAI